MAKETRVRPGMVILSIPVFIIGRTIFKNGLTQGRDIWSIMIMMCGLLFMLLAATLAAMYIYGTFKPLLKKIRL